MIISKIQSAIKFQDLAILRKYNQIKGNPISDAAIRSYIERGNSIEEVVISINKLSKKQESNMTGKSKTESSKNIFYNIFSKLWGK